MPLVAQKNEPHDDLATVLQQAAKRRQEYVGLFKGLPSRLLRKFSKPRTGNRGRIWLDPETFRLWRWENESTVVDQDTPSEVVYLPDEVEYQSSSFGVNLPTKIVTTFFDKKESDKRSVRVSGRITYTYEAFKRFVVDTDYQIQKAVP